ncbi:MAG: RNA-binding protein [Saprospirales bacterium]|nr:MAG: RNA-binding protein [Saprospirales bacterium]
MLLNKILLLCGLAIVLIFSSCNGFQSEDGESIQAGVTTSEAEPLPEMFKDHRGFEILPPETTGIDFVNWIKEDFDYNVMTYEYLYNGAGVAAGDISGNGYPDLYFVSTMGPNKLYLNKGNYEFEDITESAGLTAAEGFQTGVTMVDINGNGLLDIYISVTGKETGSIKRNLLFINNGDLTFTESAAEFGLDAESNSNHANFFDMNGNGYLDVYMINHPLTFQEAVTLRLRQREDGSTYRLTHPRTPYESDRLYRNNGGFYEDITAQAGMENSAYGLSVIISDINLNGLPDIFVGNDYIEPDHLYINKGNGVFEDKAMTYFRQMCQNSMGADIADFNNNGLPDIVVLDMVAEDHARYKELMNVMTVSRHNLMLEYDYGHQYVRNVLQMNAGQNANGDLEFSEIGRLAGVSNTDWSWGALFADFTNNTLKDLYIANGYLRDVTDLDYVVYTLDSINRTGGVTNVRFPDINTVLELVPSNPLPNYLYLNQGDLTFFDATATYGIDQPTFSSGSIYVDLNRDGNLDLVVSNINSPALVVQNKGSNNNYLQITTTGPGNNTRGIGTKAWATTGELTQYLELNGNRGFFSTSEHMLHFGLGDNEQVDQLLIVWPDNTFQKLHNVEANQRIHIEYAPEGTYTYPGIQSRDELFTTLSSPDIPEFHHRENDFEDFHRERLLPHRLSRLGPGLEVADFTGNGLEDFFIGGAKGQAGALFIQNQDGSFTKTQQAVLEADKEYEDVDAMFFDANDNGLLDLLVLSGGYSEPINSPLYNDRLYLNDGNGNLVRDESFPKIPTCSGPGLVHDFEGEGNPFIFVGGRALPVNYPLAPTSYILQRRGDRYVNITSRVFPDFNRIGMVTGIEAADLNGNGVLELVVTGEWMPIAVYSFEDGQFVERTEEFGLDRTNGWWYSLHVEDITGDGKMEIIGGNLGLNSRYKASQEKPIVNIARDFDRNGMIDAIMCYYHDGELYPYHRRDDLIGQIPELRAQFPRYRHYSDATLDEVFSPEQIAEAHRLEAYTMETSIFKMQDGVYQQMPLSNEAQVSPVFDILVDDFDGDGIKDVLLVGNHIWADVETGAYDASKGVLMRGNADGAFTFEPNRNHGLWASEEARKIRQIKTPNGETWVLIANSDSPLQFFRQNISAQPEL